MARQSFAVHVARIFAPIRPIAFKALHPNKAKYVCPICNYSGPLVDLHSSTGARLNAQCPRCGGVERHRLQWLALDVLQREVDFSAMDVLHFAPEPFLGKRFKRDFKSYTTADLTRPDVDHKADLTALQFPDASYDFVYASHVLEHIKNDTRAVAEIRRVLRPNGIAILPVPIVGQTTVEYPAPNPSEDYHMRAPGPDYFDRYRTHFSKVRVFSSADFDGKHQVFVYQDRSQWPTAEMPLRQPAPGDRHPDFVPVCFV